MLYAEMKRVRKEEKVSGTGQQHGVAVASAMERA
jgi:hypothetical protein